MSTIGPKRPASTEAQQAAKYVPRVAKVAVFVREAIDSNIVDELAPAQYKG